MDIDVNPKNHRKSSIICTIGPKTNDVEMIIKLRQAGMNIARMNFSHGSYEYHQSVIDNVRASFDIEKGNPVAIALDTKGPEIRTGLMKDNLEVEYNKGHEMIFTTNEDFQDNGDLNTLFIDYKNLSKVLRPDKIIYIDDGINAFQTIRIEDDKVYVRALSNGKLASKKGVNLPNTNVDLPALSNKDKQDLEFGIKNKVDIIFASFIRNAENIKQIRQVLGEEGKNIKIIAKIENYQGVKNFDEILEEADGVMVARGDLGIEIPCSRVFIAQKALITKCNLKGKPVICATQMLESMTVNPRPTRAEISDVANAILDGADCVMLSGETAKGNYPIDAVKTMSLVCSLAESVVCYEPLFNEIKKCVLHPRSVAEITCASAVSSTIEEPIKAIFVLTTTGESARLISKYRPPVPIFTISRSEQVCRQIHLYRGCYPMHYPYPKPNEYETKDPWQKDVDHRLEWAIENAIRMNMLKKGDYVIAVQGWKGGIGNTNSTRILQA